MLFFVHQLDVSWTNAEIIKFRQPLLHAWLSHCFLDAKRKKNGLAFDLDSATRNSMIEMMMCRLGARLYVDSQHYQPGVFLCWLNSRVFYASTIGDTFHEPAPARVLNSNILHAMDFIWLICARNRVCGRGGTEDSLIKEEMTKTAIQLRRFHNHSGQRYEDPDREGCRGFSSSLVSIVERLCALFAYEMICGLMRFGERAISCSFMFERYFFLIFSCVLIFL